MKPPHFRCWPHASTSRQCILQPGSICPRVHYCLPGLEDAVNDPALMVDLRFRRIEILGAFRIGFKYPSPESENLSRQRMDREHYPAAEPVKDPLFMLDRQSGLYKKICLNPSSIAFLENASRCSKLYPTSNFFRVFCLKPLSLK